MIKLYEALRAGEVLETSTSLHDLRSALEEAGGGEIYDDLGKLVETVTGDMVLDPEPAPEHVAPEQPAALDDSTFLPIREGFSNEQKAYMIATIMGAGLFNVKNDEDERALARKAAEITERIENFVLTGAYEVPEYGQKAVSYDPRTGDARAYSKETVGKRSVIRRGQ